MGYILSGRKGPNVGARHTFISDTRELPHGNKNPTNLRRLFAFMYGCSKSLFQIPPLYSLRRVWNPMKSKLILLEKPYERFTGPTEAGLPRIIWRSPRYRLHTNSGLEGGQSYKEILIDVTKSIPPFPETKQALAETFADVLRDFSGKDEIHILDFGAGRFRNTIHLLRTNPKAFVGAVEFRELEGISKTHIDEAMRFQRRFRRITYPEDFFTSTQTFDLIILINVLNIMPIPSERLLAIQYCRQKLNEGGKILWYTQHKDRYYQEKCTEDNELGDGYHMRNKTSFQTFYRDFEPYEVDEMFLANGMKFDRKIVTSGVIARLYKTRTTNPIEGIVSPDLIRTHVDGDHNVTPPPEGSIRTVRLRDHTRPNLPNPHGLSFENLYIAALRALPAGPAANYAYQNLIAATLLRTLVRAPDSLELEKEIISGEKRVDIFISNNAEKGFFHTAASRHHIISPYILVECKNLSDGWSNNDIDQLAARLSDDWGRLGILACRGNIDRDTVLRKARAVRRVEAKNHILCMEDSDFIQLLQLHLQDPDESDEYMNQKLEEIRLH